MPSHQERRTPLDAAYQFPTNRVRVEEVKDAHGELIGVLIREKMTWAEYKRLYRDLTFGFNESDHE